MTNELGTTLHDIEAKAERKREAFGALDLYARKILEIIKNDNT